VRRTSSSSHPAARRRPPALLIAAWTGFLAVLVLGIAVVAVRGRGPARESPDDGDRAASSPPADSEGRAPPAPPPLPPAPPSPSLSPPLPPSSPSSPPSSPASAAAETDNGRTGQRGATGELPIWERPPLRTSQPFPESARAEAPPPPVKLQPWMLSPPAPAPASEPSAP